jgi:cell wall-associated NlpC family hydrolase
VILTVANYLKANGAPEHLLTAVRHYDHTDSYVRKILDRATEYAARNQPGGLTSFNSGPGTTPDRPGHVGIVIGDGKMIAAPHIGTIVQVQPYTRQSLIGFTRPSTICP